MQPLRLILFITLLWWPAVETMAQTKFEQEQRIKVSEVPAPASDFIAQCPITKGIKWYRENSNQGLSFEAKFKLRGLKYSVEFSADGALQDIEIKIPFNSLDKDIQSTLNQELNNTFLRHRIQKTQIQHQGSSDLLLKLMQGESVETSVAYELIVKGRQKQNSHYYEVLADARGNIIKQLQIELRPADNLDF